MANETKKEIPQTSRIIGTRPNGDKVLMRRPSRSHREAAFARLASGSYAYMDIIPKEVPYIRKEASRGGYNYHKACEVFRRLEVEKPAKKRIWVTPKKK